MKKISLAVVSLFLVLLTLTAFQQKQIWSTVATGTSLPSAIPRVGYLFFRTSDASLHVSDGSAWNTTKPAFLEFFGQGLEATASNGAGDTTAYYIPMKAFSTNDSATFDFEVSNDFISIDSIVVLGTTVSATGDSAAFSLQIKQTAQDSAYVEAFNTATIDTVDLGAGAIQKSWRFTSFGTLTDSLRSTMTAKIWRSACTNDAAADVLVERVLLYVKGGR